MMSEEDEEMNIPDMDKVAYDVAIEAVARMFIDLRKAGLSTTDAAAIVAATLKGADGV